MHLDLDRPSVFVTNMRPIEEVVNITLVCNVSTSDTISNYTWYYNNTELAHQRHKEYHLNGGNRSNTGNYFCSVKTDKLEKKNSSAVNITFLCKYTKLSGQLLKLYAIPKTVVVFAICQFSLSKYISHVNQIEIARHLLC